MPLYDPSSIPSVDEVNKVHQNSDVDKSRLSQHHTLGTSATQAAAGNHNHDGISSVKVKVTDLDGTISAANGLPAGGTAGQILSKIDATNYNAQWITNTAIQKGDGIFVYIRNNTGSTLTKGQIVYTTGAAGAKVTVALALATSDQYSARTLGWVENDILNNDYGWVQIEGYLSGIDTASVTDGAQLYLSGTTAGGWQSTKPSAPTHLVYVGVVAKAASAAGGGAVLVKVQNGYELDEIHDALITSKANLDVLSYESSTNLWKNKTLANAGIAASGHVHGNVSNTGTITTAGTLGATPKLLIADSTTNAISVYTPTGTASSTTFLTGNGTWATPVSGTTSNYYELGSTYSLDDSTTNYRTMLNGKSFTITPGVWQFSGNFYVQAQFFTTSTAWSSNFQFNFATLTGTNAINNIQYDYHIASNTTSFATAATPTIFFSSANTARTLSASLSTGSRYIVLKVTGIVRVSGSGTATFAPACNQSLAQNLGNLLNMQAGTNFTIAQIGTYTATTDAFSPSTGTWV